MINTIFSRILLVFFTIIIGIFAIPIALIQAFFYDGLLFFFDDWEKLSESKTSKMTGIDVNKRLTNFKVLLYCILLDTYSKHKLQLTVN